MKSFHMHKVCTTGVRELDGWMGRKKEAEKVWQRVTLLCSLFLAIALLIARNDHDKRHQHAIQNGG